MSYELCPLPLMLGMDVLPSGVTRHSLSAVFQFQSSVIIAGLYQDIVPSGSSSCPFATSPALTLRYVLFFFPSF